jgi:histone-lysine N-methyltransferase SETMAR
MNEHKQRFEIKFIWLQEHGSKVIHAQLRGILGPCAVSLPTVKRWLRRFRAGDTSCEDQPRSGRPLAILGDVLGKFLSKHPFASAKIMAAHFNLTPTTVKEILIRELGFRKFTRRWVPHLLSAAQKKDRVDQCKLLLGLLREQSAHNFNTIATGDESWFRYAYPARTMYAGSRSEVTPFVRSGISASKVMLTVFFTGTRLLVVDALPKGRKYNQEYFIEYILPLLSRQKSLNRRQKPPLDFIVHMDNSMCHNGREITAKMESEKIERAPHPAYSPDVSPCDFWLFGFMKEKLKEQKLSTPQKIIEAITVIWDAITFEELQSVFFEWQQRVTWVNRNRGEYFIK